MVRASMRVTATTEAPPDTPADTIAVGVFEGDGVAHDTTGGELQGLYEATDRRSRPRVTVWMLTAKRGQVVAYRTFLRTLLHELCHHLDYDLLRLRDSLHTHGFYQRESSLFHALDAGRVDAPTSIEG